jgi:hypothetical protein
MSGSSLPPSSASPTFSDKCCCAGFGGHQDANATNGYPTDEMLITNIKPGDQWWR